MSGLRLQFTIRRLLLATFWMAICMGAGISSVRRDGSEGLSVALLVVAVVSPCVAIGTLFGKPFIGMLVGILVLIALQIIG